MMCTVQYWLLYYRRMKRIVMARYYECRLFLFHSSQTVAEEPQMCCKLFSFCCPCTDVEVKEELSDVDDTASGTDWLMLNSQQYLMHCLQHRKKHHTVRLLLCSENVLLSCFSSFHTTYVLYISNGCHRVCVFGLCARACVLVTVVEWGIR